MIKVQAGGDGDRRTLHMSGHAEYATGNDIVCAGCSAIAYALIGWIANSPEHMRDVDEMYEALGHVLISAQGDECFQAVFDMAVIGLAQIGRKYPENVELEKFF